MASRWSSPRSPSAGVLLAALLRRRDARRLRARVSIEAACARLRPALDPVRPNWWILGGSLVFVAISLSVGSRDLQFSQEIIFVSSFAVITFLMAKLLRELDEDARRTLLGTAIVIFVFRAMPGAGAGSTWWMIDELGFDQSFLAQALADRQPAHSVRPVPLPPLHGRRSIAYIVGFLTLASTAAQPADDRHVLRPARMDRGAHRRRGRRAFHCASIDTALESPLGQIAMVPMLAWIANSAPANLKATYFAVMASFTNLALSAAQLGTKYLNQIFEVTREVRDPLTHEITVAADYGELGALFIVATALGLILPFAAIGMTRCCSCAAPEATRLALRFGDEYFDPPVHRATGDGRVVGNRLGRTPAVDRDPTCGHPARDQIVARRRSAIHRQRIVHRVAPRAVGMADDRDRCHRVLLERRRQTIENRTHIRLDVIAADVEGNIARNVELELIVGGLRNLYPGAGRGLLHRRFLFLHALRPEVASRGPEGGPDGGTGSGTFALVAAGRRTADDGAGHGADRGAGSGVTLGFGHAGTPYQRTGSEGDGGQGSNGSLHVLHLFEIETGSQPRVSEYSRPWYYPRILHASRRIFKSSPVRARRKRLRGEPTVVSRRPPATNFP
jgi:hypothetical protein